MNVVLFMLIAIFWGGSYIAIKDLVEIVPPVMAATVRVGSAILLLAVVLPLLGKSLVLAKPLIWRMWLTGLFMIGIPFSLLFWGEKQISPGLAGILNGSTPLWTFILSLIFLRTSEKFSKINFTGLAFGISGLFLIFYPKLFLSKNSVELMGAISVSLMALSYAIGTVLAKLNSIGSIKADLYSGLFHQLLASFVFLLITSLYFEDWTNWTQKFQSPSIIAAELYLSWVSTALAFSLFYYLLNQWGAVRTSAVTYIVPMVAVILDFIINQDVPTVIEVSGTLIILTGVLLIQLPKFSKA